MLEIPSKVVQKAVDSLAQLPGIGKKTALRLVLHMIHQSPQQVKVLAQAFDGLSEGVTFCSKCHNLSDEQVCDICSNQLRNQELICVVRDVRDVLAIESTGQYRGLYHVLGGLISPMDGIGPNQLHIETLLQRIDEDDIQEVMFAINGSMEGETTMFYIYKQLEDQPNIRFSMIAQGIAVGAELEYADEITLGKSISNRIPYEQSFKK